MVKSGIYCLEEREMTEKKIELIVNGEDVALAPFVRDILKSTVKGFVSELKGCEEPESIELKIYE